MTASIKNYVYGAGKLYFDPFVPGTTTLSGMRYFGNTTKYTVSQKVTTADSHSSYGGIISKDSAKVIQVDVGGKFTTDNINTFNVSQFFSGVGVELTPPQLYETVLISPAKEGVFYQIGFSKDNPLGWQDLSNVTITASGVSTPMIGIDYELDAAAGIVGIPKGSRLIGKAISVSCMIGSYFKSAISVGKYSVAGALRFVPKTVVGEGLFTYIPNVCIRASEDYDFKSNSYQQMTFEFDALQSKPTSSVFNTTIAGL